LANIYAFLRDTGRFAETPELAAEVAADGTGAAVSMFDGRCPLCTATMDIFTRHLAAEAGNFALKTMAEGGVYLGGGIPAKILPRLRRPEFLATFNDKGRMESLMRSMPVRVILNDRAALLGAAQAAVELFV
ncbi:MAG: glucokinase, partial [Terrimicrobiaceae bacterium]|nr:glucokinase [Terrimicrobiaceae bacterium]